MKKKLYVFLMIIVWMSAFCVEGLWAETLRVGTKEAPPFAMKDKEGHWEGISIELWDRIAKNLKLDYVFVNQKDIDHLLAGVRDASLDAGIAAITITAPRETVLDFSHSYFTTGLGIAVPKKEANGWVTVMRALFSFKMLLIISFLVLILLLVGTLAWLMERKRNPEHFDPNPIKGIAGGIWWAAVTMTTVGYGDLTPKTMGGRLIALLWMFASMLLVSSVIATVASTLTLAKLEPEVSGPNDLAKIETATIASSISDKYLRERHLRYVYYDSVDAGLKGVKNGEVGAMVYDEPLLKYTIMKKFSQSLMVTDALFENQNYAIAFPEKSPLREKVNRELLKIIHSQEWQHILHKYLGT